MKHDSQIALGLTGLSLLLLLPTVRLPLLDLVSSPVAIIAFVLAIGTLLMKEYTLSAIVLIAVGLYLARGSSPREHRIYLSKSQDESRFGADSVDIQIANRTFRTDSPSMLDTSQPASPLLTYPPSEETLRSLSGI
jgi:hypothetical protein